MRFTGAYNELIEKLKLIFPEHEWIDLSENQKQCKHQNGAVINWYPTTGSITIQAADDLRITIESVVKELLDKNEPEIISDPDLLSNIKAINTVVPENNSDQTEYEYLEGRYDGSELVIGLVGAVGTNQKIIIDNIIERLRAYKYDAEVIEVSKDVISKIYAPSATYTSEFNRIQDFIDKGNNARKNSNDNSILALGISAEIMSRRERDEYSTKPRKHTAYIIKSLKHPKEVERLREIYSAGFFLIGIYADENRRFDYLHLKKRMSQDEANILIARDMDEVEEYGQHTRDTFQMADFFVHLDNNYDQVNNSICRILDLIFGNPFLTPTFDEYAMFMAFASALRSADLSRQVGAVIAKNNEIIASGANDCPKAGGGLYWPEYDERFCDIRDYPNGRDYMRGEDSNKVEQRRIIEDVIKCLGLGNDAQEKLTKSRITDITEYGRVVHAEMEALLMCARNNVSTRDATLYCTTFPCHNCAKHIIAAGIKRVIYVEPYPKSKAFEFHADSTTDKRNSDGKLVEFVPFVGIGPRKYFELFSMKLSSGYNMVRKEKNGSAIKWNPENAKMRCQLLPCSYLEREALATKSFDDKRRCLI